MAGENRRRRLRALLARAGVRIAGDITLIEQAFVHESSAKEGGGRVERADGVSRRLRARCGHCALALRALPRRARGAPHRSQGGDRQRRATRGERAPPRLFGAGCARRRHAQRRRNGQYVDPRRCVRGLRRRRSPCATGSTKARTFVVREHIEALDHAPDALLDAKTRLQHYAQEHLSATPVYHERSDGTAQRPHFHSTVQVKGKTLGTGSGPSKKAAQQAAASAALASLLPD